MVTESNLPTNNPPMVVSISKDNPIDRLIIDERFTNIVTTLDRELAKIAVLNEERFKNIDKQLSDIDRHAKETSEDISHSISNLDIKTQAANIALQRIVEAMIDGVSKLAEQRFESARLMVNNSETQIENENKLITQIIDSIEMRTSLRHDAAIAAINTLEEKLTSQILALRALIDLRSQMGETAITKAEQATDKRFENFSDFRQLISDQVRALVTTTTMDGRIAQVMAQLDVTNKQVNTNSENLASYKGEIGSRMASLESKFYIGGSGVVILITVLQLILNLIIKK